MYYQARILTLCGGAAPCGAPVRAMYAQARGAPVRVRLGCGAAAANLVLLRRCLRYLGSRGSSSDDAAIPATVAATSTPRSGADHRISPLALLSSSPPG